MRPRLTAAARPLVVLGVVQDLRRSRVLLLIRPCFPRLIAPRRVRRVLRDAVRRLDTQEASPQGPPARVNDHAAIGHLIPSRLDQVSGIRLRAKGTDITRPFRLGPFRVRVPRMATPLTP